MKELAQRAMARLEIAAPIVKIHPKTGNQFIKFKCPANLNKATDKTLPKMIQKIADTIDANSKKFSGVDASGLVVPTKGNFQFGRQYFKGSDKKIYSIGGTDTESASGFSIIMQRWSGTNVDGKLVKPVKYKAV